LQNKTSGGNTLEAGCKVTQSEELFNLSLIIIDIQKTVPESKSCTVGGTVSTIHSKMQVLEI